MKLRFLIIPAFMAATLLAQGPGGPGGFGGRRGNGTGTPPTPPSAAQLAANALTTIARFLHLTSAQTSALTGNTALVGIIEAEQAKLQAIGQTLRIDYAAETSAIAAGQPVPANVTTDIANQNAASHAERVAATTQILAALPGAGVPALTSTQQTSLINLLVRGSGPGGPGGSRGPRF